MTISPCSLDTTTSPSRTSPATSHPLPDSRTSIHRRPAMRDRDSIGVRWPAHDDNDDQLVYSVYYRGDGESRWLLLKDNLSDRYYSFDASLLPDGGYTVKVVASDAPSHSPGRGPLRGARKLPLRSRHHSPRHRKPDAPHSKAKQIHVRFRAADSLFSDQARRVFARWRRLAVRRADRPAVRFKNRRLRFPDGGAAARSHSASDGGHCHE